MNALDNETVTQATQTVAAYSSLGTGGVLLIIMLLTYLWMDRDAIKSILKKLFGNKK